MRYPGSSPRTSSNPYFGPSHRSGIPFDVPPELREPGRDAPRVATNNFGFVSPYNLPIDRGNNEFIIGIFGGSVSVWFCQVGVQHLLDDLRQHEFFKARTLVPLCMAHEGYKQPQQALILAYFLSIGQPFDLVINIDGLNEVALSSINNQQRLDISMPSASHLIPLINLIDKGSLTPERLESLAAVIRYRSRLNNCRRDAQSQSQRGGRCGAWRLSNVADRSLRAGDPHVRQPPVATARQLVDRRGSANRRTKRAMLFQEIARNWAQASLLMHSMLAARNVPYVHVLQPNQYHHTSRSFGAEESAVAFSSESAFKSGVEQGYPVLLAEAATQGLATRAGFFDGTRIFDAEPRLPISIIAVTTPGWLFASRGLRRPGDRLTGWSLAQHSRAVTKRWRPVQYARPARCQQQRGNPLGFDISGPSHIISTAGTELGFDPGAAPL